MNYLTAQLRKSIKTAKGFSLIELMIVVAVIAILAVVGVTVFSGVQQNARDSRRKADIDAIVKAIEAKKVANSAAYAAIAATDFAGGSIPTDTSNSKYCGRVATTGTVASPSAWAVTDACPDTTNWSVIGTTNFAGATAFQVCARLENGTNQFYCKANAQ